MTALRASRMETIREALARGPLTVRELCTATGIDQSTLNKTLIAMAKSGLAARKPNLNQSGRQIRQGPKRCPYVWSLA